MNMMFGEALTLTIFGESHGQAVGGVLNGLPGGLPIDMEAIASLLQHRRPGVNGLVTPRNEADEITWLSGVRRDQDSLRTAGTPLAFMTYNTNVRSQDYASIVDVPRPGHADITQQMRYGSAAVLAGGGHSSGRLTWPFVAAYGLVLPLLTHAGISARARMVCVGTEESPQGMVNAIAAAQESGDGIGSQVALHIEGVPAGWGTPHRLGIESQMSAQLFAIPGVKAVEFGDGVSLAYARSSEVNDRPLSATTRASNHLGGIEGGISTGMPIDVRVTFRPPASIKKQQTSIDLRTDEAVSIEVTGRHDPCLGVRGAVVVEAVGALVMADLWVQHNGMHAWSHT